MGYHIFPGALSALLVARLTGAKAMYQMTAGPVEVIGGGYRTENPLLSRLHRPSRLLEALALRLCNCFDALIVRGNRSRNYLRSRLPDLDVRIIAGSILPSRFEGGTSDRDVDLIYVGRLMPIKQPDQVIDVVAATVAYKPDVRAVIVGDGPLKERMLAKRSQLGVEANVEFAGHIEKVEDYLRRSKIFLLTSRSEGLSIALAEAMCAGAVPVVADVGDLGDLVVNGETGYRSGPGDFEDYARQIDALLSDTDFWSACSDRGHQRAIENNGLAHVANRWRRCFEEALATEPSVRSRRSLRPLRLPPANSTGRGSMSRLGYRLWQRVPGNYKKRMAPLLETLPPQYLLGSKYRECRSFVANSEFKQSGYLKSYQLDRLREICIHAFEQSPFYQKWFDKCGFDPYQLEDLEQLREIPPIDQETVRERLFEMMTVPAGSLGADEVWTGGTGGRPLRFFINAGRSAVEYAHLTQGWSRADYELGMKMAVLRGHQVEARPDGLRHEYDPLLRHHLYSAFHMSEEMMARYLDHIGRIGPCYLHVYPSSATALARYLRHHGRSTPTNIRGILAESEILYPDQKQFIEETFNCRCFSSYGQSEKVVLAAFCEKTSNYHVWPTYSYFELLDETGRPIRTPGERGEIVGTGFINTVVPFIRYRTGDFATFISDGCEACGRAHPVITDIRGHRIQEFLFAADGSRIPWAAVNTHDDTFMGVRQFQFYQERPGQAVLRLVPMPGFGAQEREQIVQKLEHRLSRRVSVTAEIVEEIPLSSRGKAVYVDQRVSLDDISSETVTTSV
jgi:phenylacetate-CoA ligase